MRRRVLPRVMFGDIVSPMQPQADMTRNFILVKTMEHVA